jgi:hypothetical protein
MSVFQTQDWWTCQVSEGEEYDFGCMVVGNIDNSPPPLVNKIAVGSQAGIFRMYQPTKPAFRVEDLVLEEDLLLAFRFCSCSIKYRDSPLSFSIFLPFFLSSLQYKNMNFLMSSHMLS